ncbi:class I SAM-dependent RNA methyltransferase [Neolewinella lacunae]|uniref:Class I SAM-dependent RNA methyltransferase n=1 Tax=Neolewinella lacunae TaxID=1517758 RepID=A0A923T7M1_9BACT|nr:class I SAM-dependent RNA methyltransferase [Neolewinella lacunae]MBC6993686.1 class I SAM-dependent RNA methyltransferase [Neolewinella lacunae]MDN3636381.1 class I SAM-dependent RNA methyltransferase [Neolewinella lacunae]
MPLPTASKRSISAPIENFAITTFAGLEEVLAAEITALGATEITVGRRVVRCQGDKTFRYRANLELRTAIRVLREVGQFRANNEQTMYDRLRGIDWAPWLKVDGNLWIDVVTQSERFRNGVYLAQLAKDAIVDQFRAKTGERPSVSKDNADLTIHLHVGRANEVTVSVDASGEGLHRRGYRNRTGGAPLNEVLAAGLLALAGFDGEVPFCDPMCGSGTLVAEAATIAAHQAPGLHREFGFQRWPDFDADLWSSIRQAALNRIRRPPYPILGADIDELTTNLAKITVDRTGLLPYVEFRASDFTKLLAPPAIRPAAGGLLVTNPPYEMRLQTGDILGLYQSIGDALKQHWAGYTAWLISGNPDAIKSVGLRTSQRIPLMNGPIEVRFCRYDLYEGSKKTEAE